MLSIWGKYLVTGITERIDNATSKGDAAYLVGEYQMAFGRDWQIWSGRKKDGDGDRSGARNEAPTQTRNLLWGSRNLR